MLENTISLDCKMYYLEASYEIDMELSEKAEESIFSWSRS